MVTIPAAFRDDPPPGYRPRCGLISNGEAVPGPPGTDTKTLGPVRTAGNMVDDPLRSRLDGLLLLQVMVVSLLAGLVFGRDYGGEAFLAVFSFPVVAVLVLPFSYVRSRPAERGLRQRPPRSLTTGRRRWLPATVTPARVGIERERYRRSIERRKGHQLLYCERGP